MDLETLSAELIEMRLDLSEVAPDELSYDEADLLAYRLDQMHSVMRKLRKRLHEKTLTRKAS